MKYNSPKMGCVLFIVGMMNRFPTKVIRIVRTLIVLLVLNLAPYFARKLFNLVISITILLVGQTPCSNMVDSNNTLHIAENTNCTLSAGKIRRS
jgi:hypothetical protein